MWRDLSLYISRFKTRIYSPAKVQDFVHTIERSNIKDKKERKNHVKQVKQINAGETETLSTKSGK